MSIFSFHNENNSTLSPGLLSNGALTCSGLHFWRHFLVKRKIFPTEEADNLHSKFAFTCFLIKPVYLWKRTLQDIIVHVYIHLFVTCKWRVYVYIDFYNKILFWCLLKNISLRKQTFLPAHCRNVCFHGLQKRAHQKHLVWFIIRIKKQSKLLKWSLMVCTCILAL